MISAMNTMLWIIWGLLMATSSVCWPEILLAGAFPRSRQALSWHLLVELARLSSTTHFKDCRWAQLMGQIEKNPPKIDLKKICEIDGFILMPATVWQIFHTKHVHLFAMTGNGSYVNLLKLAWSKLVKSLVSSEQNWAKWQNPAKNRCEKICEIDGSFYMPATVWRIFHTKRVHLLMQRPEMEVMSICWSKIVKLLLSSELILEVFSRLEPLWWAAVRPFFLSWPS